MARYRLCIAYDGTDFHGWQKQGPSTIGALRVDASGGLGGVEGSLGGELGEGLRTVQGVVERAIREAVREPVVLVGASRTDAGVHARAQTGAFSVSDERRGGAPEERLALAINARLPEDVVVRSCVRTREDFAPITECVAKGYRYALHVSSERPLWDRRFVHHLWRPVDEGAMVEAAGLLVGEHDFGGFAAAGHGRESTVRRVLSCEVSRPSPRRVHIDVSGTGFLWNMVRIIAGTLVEVGLGRMTGDDIRAALATGDRRRAGPTMPARGLCLMWGRYPGDALPEEAGEEAGPSFGSGGMSGSGWMWGEG